MSRIPVIAARVAVSVERIDRRGSQLQAQHSSDYSLRILKKLDETELSQLAKSHIPALLRLSCRYVPNIDTSNGIPLRAEYLDVLRGCWLLDTGSDKPSHDDVVSGVGYGFGLLLGQIYGMEWCLIEDAHGECISMVKQGPEKTCSIPPFSYVLKRQDAQNVEVITDGIREAGKLLG